MKRRKVDFNSVGRLMKSQQNIITHRKLVCVASVKHNTVIRIPYEDFKGNKGIKQKGAFSLVYPVVREFKDDAGELHVERNKSDEWYFCEKSMYKRFKSGEKIEFKYEDSEGKIRLKNVIE